MEAIPETNGVIAVSIGNGNGVQHTYDKDHQVKPEPTKTNTLDAEINPSQAVQAMEPITKVLKKIKKGIYISYSPDAGFQERAFISDLVRQLKENNMADDIWFDKDENCIDSPIWFSQRMEAVEKCQAAILILSDAYFTCPVSVYESRTLFERQLLNLHSVQTFSVLYSELSQTNIPKNYTNSNLLLNTVDLTTTAHSKLSVAEKTSVVLSGIMESLEKFAVINSPLHNVDVEPQFNLEFKSKVIVLDILSIFLKLTITYHIKRSMDAKLKFLWVCLFSVGPVLLCQILKFTYLAVVVLPCSRIVQVFYDEQTQTAPSIYTPTCGDEEKYQ